MHRKRKTSRTPTTSTVIEMAFAAARMILKDKRRKTSKEDFAPRNKSKVTIDTNVQK